MKVRDRSTWGSLILLAGSLAVLFGCAAAGSPRDAEALRRRFPDQAENILRAASGFTSTEEGFDVPTGALFGGLRGRMPSCRDGAVELTGPGSRTVRVRELGSSDEGMLAEGAVVYVHPAGASYWAATAAGYEEWLWIEPDRLVRDAPVAEWEVEGGALQQSGDAVEVTDARGEAWIRVTAPEAYAMGGRPVATRLSTRGSRLELWVEASGEVVLVDPGWSAVGPAMQVARVGATVTVVRDAQQHERALVVGGSASSGPVADVEWFDTTAGTWASLPPMQHARSRHTATLLQDGRVLVAGGEQYGTAAELFDPETQVWTPAPPMSVQRSGHTATLLEGTGLVLVAGGDGAGTAEIFDPSGPTWTKTASMHAARVQHTATRLAGDRVLVAGGAVMNGGPVTTAEIYDPAKQGWDQPPAMSWPRAGHTATLLDDGGVLVAGGFSTLDGYVLDQALSTAELFDPGLATWIAASSMSSPHAGHTATLLDDGRVLVAGGTVGEAGVALGSTEIYDPATCWASVAPLRTARRDHAATVLSDGRVLAVGGNTGSEVLGTAELFDPTSQGWALAAPMEVPRVNHTATALLDGRILVAGGDSLRGNRQIDPGGDRHHALDLADLFDPQSHQWSPAPPMGTARFGHSTTRLASGSVLVAGGCNSADASTVVLASTELFDPVSQVWSPLASMSHEREGHTATLLSDGSVLVTGGHAEGVAFADAELFDPQTKGWTAVAPMSTARDGHTATLLDDGRVLVAGGKAIGSPPLDSAEVFDPTSKTWAPAAPMKDARTGHTATLLAGGAVLVAGGLGEAGTLAGAEIRDPNGGAWKVAGDMGTARYGHTATLLPDGRVLVAGGVNQYVGGPVSTADTTGATELFDPAAGTWTASSSLRSPRVGHTATQIGTDATILVTGGLDGALVLSSTELFGLVPDGTSCLSPLDCRSGFCVDGVCCDRACGGGLCEACSTIRGAVADGTCTELHPECSPFACLPDTGTCADPCQSARDCATGYACDGSGHCVPPPPGGSYRDDGGCDIRAPAAGPSAPRAPEELCLALVAALALLRRRRQRPDPDQG